jgi:2-polyprenyl-3-methyl-5-hydroxy-6-metoxy-1,4-benzoquinol methylase
MFSLVVVALVSGWQLGRRRSVRQVENESLVAYQSWSIYRDSAYNESGFRDWEASAIAAYFPKSGRVLVPSCGGGREVLVLARSGFEVVAFECQPSFVVHCQDLLAKHEIPAQIFQAPPSEVAAEVRGMRFDAALVGWGGYMHIQHAQRRVAFLRDVRKMMPVGAPILISFFTRREQSKFFFIVYWVARVAKAISGSSLPIERGDNMDGSFDHHFTDDEIREECKAAGFEVLVFHQRPYGHVVARAT